MLSSQFSNIRRTGLDQSSPVHPVSDFRGGSLSVTEKDGRTEILVSNIGYRTHSTYCKTENTIQYAQSTQSTTVHTLQQYTKSTKDTQQNSTHSNTVHSRVWCSNVQDLSFYIFVILFYKDHLSGYFFESTTPKIQTIISNLLLNG